MVGKDLNEHPAARKQAQKRVDEARMVFTTCAGASLGLLRALWFPVVVIDEASQQVEPQSLIPLSKGCRKAVLVGDHVQLRATVHPHAQLQSFDVSLFERLYTMNSSEETPEKTSPAGPSSFCKVMLDTQYRMHASICAFSSRQFYKGRLKTAVADSQRPLPTGFPWRCASGGSEAARLVFVQCSHPEDLGGRSKNNKGQVAVARSACAKLLATGSTVGGIVEQEQQEQLPSFTVAVLTPYTATVKELQSNIPSSVVVSSIDGFQGQEADVVIFVTTRCNLEGDIGFLRDMRG